MLSKVRTLRGGPVVDERPGDAASGEHRASGCECTRLPKG